MRGIARALAALAAIAVVLASVARGDARVDALVPTFSWESVWRAGTSQPVEIIGKYTIRNAADEDVDLAGLALVLRFPGDVVVTSDDGGYSTNAKALAKDWTFVCLWTFVEGSSDGSNACSNIDFVVKDDGTLEVRFIDAVVLCPGCTLRGDSQYKSFVLKHSSYFGVVRDADDFMEIAGIDAFDDVPPPPPPKRTVCFPNEVDFSFRVASYPSRFDDAGDSPPPFGTAGYDAFVRVFLDVRNRQSVPFTMDDVVIRLPFDWSIKPSPDEAKIRQDPDDFFLRCHGANSLLCDYARFSRAEDAVEVAFAPGFALCPGCAVRGSGPQGAAFELYSPFLFPIDVDSVRGANAFCRRGTDDDV
jgi:hypothetical protein